MRLPVPERFSARASILFALFLFLGQQAAGTDIVFSVLTVVFVGLFVLGFNLGGGLLYPSGAFIFFNGVLTAIFGLSYKVLLFEPGQASLLNGNKAMLCYCGGMLSMVVAVGLSSRLRTRRGLLATIAKDQTMKRAAIGFLVLGGAITLLTLSSGEGSLGSALRQINYFIPMATVLAATYEFHHTDGRKCANWIVYTSLGVLSVQGVLSFSKQGMFTGPVTWLIVAISLGYNFSKKQILAYCVTAFLVIYYLVPYSQYVRGFITTNRADNFDLALKYLGDLNETRSLYLATLAAHDTNGEPHLYSTQQGFFDRLNMLAYDDAIISYTDQGNVFGLLPTFSSYINIVPHFIWKDKPFFAFGNVYGRELGVIDQDDLGTGISFSPTGDAYHEATWLGVLCVWPVVAFIFFFITDSLTGSVREAPWALLPITFASHQAPEGMMAGTVFLSTYGVVALLAMFAVTKYVFPLITDFITRGERSRLLPAPSLRPQLQAHGLDPAVSPADLRSSS